MSDNYGTVEFIREMTDVPREESSDSEVVNKRDKLAIPRLNEDIMIEHTFEEVKSVSDEKRNTIDGSNKTFYLKELHANQKFLGDLSDDGEVSGKDIEVQYRRDGEILDDDNFNVTVVNDFTGEFQLEFGNNYTFEDGTSVSSGDALLSSGSLYIARYRTSPVRVQPASHSLKKASAFLTAYYAYSRIEVRKLESFSLDDVSISEQSKAEDAMLEMYKEEIRKMTQTEVIQSKQNKNSATGAIRESIREQRQLRGSRGNI